MCSASVCASSSGTFAVVERDTTFKEINKDGFEPIFVNSDADVAPANENELPYMVSAMFATIIEDAIQSACILGECNNSLRVKKVMANLHNLKAKKFGIKMHAVKDGIYYPVTSVENKLRKMMTDKQLFLDVLHELYRDLSLKGEFKCFVELLGKKTIADKRLQLLQDEAAKNKAKCKELRRLLRQQRNAQKSVVYEFEGNVDRLRAQIEDTEQIGIFKTVYHIKWQRSRREQYELSLKDIQHKSAHSIDYYKNKLLQENRVHNELELFNNVVINEKLTQIERAMDKYETDNEAMDLRVRVMKSDYIKMVETREAKERSIEKREEEMMAWKRYKEGRESDKLYKMKMTKSALIVQAWWRGILQRQQLGPFRPKRGKKKLNIYSTVKKED